MTTNITMDVQIISGGDPVLAPDLLTISFVPAMENYRTAVSPVSIQYSLDLIASPIDNIFTSIDNAIAYFKTQGYAQQVIDAMNATFNEYTFTLGEQIQTTQEEDKRFDAAESAIATLNSAVSGKASSSALASGLAGKQNTITAGAHIGDAATDAATNAPTTLNVVTTLLGSLTGEVNATNAKQNALAAKYNDLAAKFNALVDHLEAQSIQA